MDKADVVDYCIGWWELKSEVYRLSDCRQISFAYRFIPKELKTNTSFPKPVFNKLPVFKYAGNKLPLSMDVKE